MIQIEHVRTGNEFFRMPSTRFHFHYCAMTPQAEQNIETAETIKTSQTC